MTTAPKAEDFRSNLLQLLASARDLGLVAVEVNAGNLHRRVGGYPGSDHRMPQCCDVMRQTMRSGDEVVDEPPGGRGARLTVRYRLPRSVEEPGNEADEPALGEPAAVSAAEKGDRKPAATGGRPIAAPAVVARASGAQALGAVAAGALALGAFAVGALAVGRLAIGRLAVSRSRVRQLQIEDLAVERLRIGELQLRKRLP